MPHCNCIPKGTVEPGYIYRKKMLPYDFMDPIEEAKDLKSERDSLVAQGLSKSAVMDRLEAAGYGDVATIWKKLSLLKMHIKIQTWVRDGRLRSTIAYLIYAIKDDTIRIGLARRAITERLSCKGIQCIMKDMRDQGVY